MLDLLGETFNAISFAGLAVALAVVVDDAVVGAENVGRRMRQQPRGAAARRPTPIVLDASHEMRSPLAYATLIALLAIVPVAVMEGRPGAFFEPLALAYALAVGAAMVVALTLTPALSLLLFSTRRGRARRSRRSLTAAAAALRPARWRASSGDPRAALIAAAAAAWSSGSAALPLLGTVAGPVVQGPRRARPPGRRPGTSNPRMTQIASQLSRELRAMPGVENVGAHVGRAVSGDQHRRRQLERGLGQHRLRRRLRRDGRHRSRMSSTGCAA